MFVCTEIYALTLTYYLLCLLNIFKIKRINYVILGKMYMVLNCNYLLSSINYTMKIHSKLLQGQN